MPLSPGIRLGPYEIASLLGAGGMGEVYKAVDTRLNRTVAIKVIGGGDADLASRERLLREARAASALNHPHICTVHDVGDADGRPFIAMEWVDGESLADRLKDARHALPFDDVLKYALQIVDALEAAHAAGVVHRDLKPANLFVTKRGDVKVLDFGLAKFTGSPSDATVAGEAHLTDPGSAVGTVAYMSPEQARGDLVDPRSDLFSFGAVLYEMVTGRRAFGASTPASTFDAILNRQPPPARQFNRDLPSAIDGVIERLLAKERSQRFGSARAVRDALDSLRHASHPSVAASGIKLAPSIAVLPFTNLSADPENEYVADGITEEIITALAQLSGLQVAARASSFAFKGRTADLAEIAARLRVAHVLTGSVRKAGTRLRVMVQLVSAHDGFQVWSERYDREADDIFAIQDEIAAAIAAKLRVALTAADEEARQKRPTENLEAYELYLKGRFLVNQRGISLRNGLECFSRALALDPNYAAAHAGIGSALGLLSFYGYAPPYEAMPKARRAAQAAIAADPTLAEPHAVLQFVAFQYDWDPAQAGREFHQAVTLDNRLVAAYLWRVTELSAYGRFEEANAIAHRAVEIDPLSAISMAVLASALLFAQLFDEAERMTREAVELDPALWVAIRLRSVALAHLSRIDEAIAAGEQCLSISQRHPRAVVDLACTYRRIGRMADAARLAEEILDRARSGYMPPTSIALALASIDRLDESFEWWERAYRERDALPMFNYWPHFPPALVADPRMRSLFARMGLTPSAQFGSTSSPSPA
ncbi:MAG TPA: protein kinase [Vicinamibacterales bacterium]|nr:protein kinase [Vicinamibacterales bacterium]